MTRTCGFMDLHQYAVESEFGYAETRRKLEVTNAASRHAQLSKTVTIPVVVHVVYHSKAQNISDEQIQEQIDVLNADFAGTNADASKVPAAFKSLVGKTKIRFALAKRDPSGSATDGIVRVKTEVAEFPVAKVPKSQERSPYIEKEVKVAKYGSAAWPREHYLNIWVCNMGGDPLGFATFPGSAAWRDGVVIDYTCFGVGSPAKAPYNKGRTTTHEVGHWLDLLHIWGDDGDGCTRSDNVSDTPNQAGHNGGKPRFPSITCGNAPNGDMFMNYMDYVDDAAMFMFTRGQVERMHASIMGARSSLLASRGLAAPTRKATSNFGVLMRVAFVGRDSSDQLVFDGVTWVPSEPE